ncbi:MAG TPA: amidohydrolase, partial [Spirochaeta sp.]|nr:amidohydrolase [Spirochaeta sp.]
MNADRIIDIHTHVQPPEVINDRKPFVASEPDFKTLYENPEYRLTGSAEVLEQMDECGVDASAILGFAWRNPELLRKHNDIIITDAAASGNRLIGLTCIYPFANGNSAADEAGRTLDAGAAGIGEVGLY